MAIRYYSLQINDGPTDFTRERAVISLRDEADKKLGTIKFFPLLTQPASLKEADGTTTLCMPADMLDDMLYLLQQEK